MLDVIRKKDIWDFMDSHKIPGALNSISDLKFTQDIWVFSELYSLSECRILEVGGGNSRVLRCLDGTRNELWNYDEFKGNVGGPSGPVEIESVNVLSGLMGSFDSQLPSSYFDVVFSISVVEHIPLGEPLIDFFKDIKRVLRVGGKSIHAIDIYLSDAGLEYISARIDEYTRIAALSGLRFEKSPAISKDLSFSCSFASNPDKSMHRWNQVSPALKRQRSVAQSVSLKMVLIRDE
jgi:hypothetical protein